MSIILVNQLKISYQAYLSFEAKQLLKQMTPETKQHFTEMLQARVNLMGETPKNKELYQEVLTHLTQQPKEETKHVSTRNTKNRTRGKK